MADSFYRTLVMLGSVSIQARIFAFVGGLALCVWTLTKLRNRVLLISICSLFISVGLGLVCFSAVPNFFDQLSYSVGVQYPPVAYLTVTLLLVMVIIVVMALRLSLVDERCRRLAQEIALMQHQDAHGLQTTTAESDR